MSEKMKREKMLEDELQKVIEATQDYCFEALEEEMETEAVDAVRKAAQELAFKRTYYDVTKDEVIYFPSVVRLIMSNSLQEKAEEYYYEEGDEFPPEYSKALRTVCREKGFVKAEDSAENDEYMEKLAQDVDLS